MKRLLAVTLAIVMILGVSVTGYAAPAWASGGGLPPGIQKQVTLAFITALKDLEEVPWAEHAVQKMFAKGLIKGYEDKTFRPGQPVSKIEAVVMALRVMGWEEKAQGIDSLPAEYRGKKVAPWATGYIKVAVDKGILDEVDLMYFNPSQPAKRWEVAKYIVRALGYEEDAQEYMDEELDYKDYPAIPVGAVGYVYLISDLGLMVGYNGVFNPEKPVTRAEMAVLMDRIDGRVERDDDEQEVEGRIVEIDRDDYELTLDVDGDEVDYQAIEGIDVYYKDGYVDFDTLKQGNLVELLLDEDGKVIYIELKDSEEEKLIQTFRGEVKELDQDNRELTIKSGTAIFIFFVRDTADIEVNGEQADLEDINTGDTVKLKVDDRNRVIEIEAEGDREEEEEEEEAAEAEGTIYAVTLGKVMGVTVKLKNGEIRTYKIDENTVIKVGGEETDADALMANMNVNVRYSAELAVMINAQNAVSLAEGVITAIDGENEGITVEVDGDEEDYLLKNADIFVGDETADFEDLKLGMEAEVRIVNGTEVAKVYAELVQIEGVVVRVDDDDMKITLKVYDTEEIYDIAEDVEVELDGEDALLEDILEDDEVELRFEDGKVAEITG